MSSQFKNNARTRQQQDIQSLHEPALKILNEMSDRMRSNLKRRSYNEENAAVTKHEFSEAIARQFRITHWLAEQVVVSLSRVGRIHAFGGYVKPKAVNQ